MGDPIKVWRNYVDGNSGHLYREIRQFTRAELQELADNFEGLSMFLRAQIRNRDELLKYPAENEE